MSHTVTLTVTVTTDEDGPNAADRIENTARRCLGLWFDPQRIDVTQTRRANDEWARNYNDHRLT